MSSQEVVDFVNERLKTDGDKNKSLSAIIEEVSTDSFPSLLFARVIALVCVNILNDQKSEVSKRCHMLPSSCWTTA